MSFLKDGVRKDFLWGVVVLMAFVLGYSIRGGGEAVTGVGSQDTAGASSDRPLLTALPKTVDQPRSSARDRIEVPVESESSLDTDRRDLRKEILDRDFLDGLLKLADRDLEKVPEVIEFIRSHEMIGELSDKELSRLARRYRAADPEAAFTWMSELEPGRGVGMVEEIGEWARTDPEGARKWIEARGRENYDHLAAAYLYWRRNVDPAETAEIAATVGDDDLRENLERFAAGGYVVQFSSGGDKIQLKVEL